MNQTARSILNGILVVVALAFVAYLVRKVSVDVEPAPCEPGGYPGRCYLAPQKACELNWARAETECKEKVRKLNLPPGRMASPIIQKCQFAALDRALTYSRSSGDECARLHEDLQAWQMRNPDLN